MSEDISAYIRLGVTVVVVAETVVSALIIANLAVTVPWVGSLTWEQHLPGVWPKINN